MTTNISLSRNTVITVGIGILILLIAFIIVLFKLLSKSPSPPTPRSPISIPKDNGALILDGKKVPVSPELEKFLREEGYATTMFVNLNGQVKIVSPNGAQIDPCGRRKGTLIEGTCDFQGVDLQAINRILILVHKKENDLCTTIEVSGTEVQVHAVDREGRWRAGQRDCHRRRPDGTRTTLQDHRP